MKIQGPKRKVKGANSLLPSAKKKAQDAKKVRHIKDCQVGDNAKDCPACKQNIAVPVKLPRGSGQKYGKQVQAAIDKQALEDSKPQKTTQWTLKGEMEGDLRDHKKRLAELEKTPNENQALIVTYKKIIKDLTKDIKNA